jgi:hypothetical protein
VQHYAYDSEYILSRITVAEILSAFGVPHVTRGRSACPIHKGDNKMSFSVDEKKGVWSCFSCGAGGGKIDLVAQLGGMSKSDAMKWIAETVGLPPEGPVLESERRQMEARRKAVETARQVQRLRESSLSALRRYGNLLRSELLRTERYILRCQSRPGLLPVGAAQEHWFEINSRRLEVAGMRRAIEGTDGPTLLQVYRNRKPHPPTEKQLRYQQEHDALLCKFMDEHVARLRAEMLHFTTEKKALQALGIEI